MKTVRRNYSVLLLLALVFAAPGIFAYFFYTHPDWLGAASTNKGRLLEPPVLLAASSDTNKSAKWQLVLWSPTACEKSCVEQLDKLARVRLALGRRLYEVTPQLLLDANALPLSDELAHALREQDIHVLKLSEGARARMPVLKNHLEIFIVNPDNYLVLAYQPSVTPGDIFHDIKQLLNTTDKTSK